MKGLYIHIPFCVRKCDYCDFVSFAGMDSYYDKYVNTVIKEMNEYCNMDIDTVFFGGGTPSVLSPKLILSLCNAVEKNFRLAPNTEWTCEANPGTLDTDKISAMLSGGINRVSVGVQSFNDTELKAAGRIHNAETAYDTVKLLDKSGFKNISIDLMASLPYQTAESFKASLDTAVSLPIKHISVYSLIIEESTPIKQKYDSGIYKEPDEDIDRELYHYTKDFLNSYGFKRYETSNYAMDGFMSRHNLKYWECSEYIGLGLAAHSYVDGVRYSNTTDLNEYLCGNFRSGEHEILTTEDMMGEFMTLGMRKVSGISETEFHNKFGKELRAVYGSIIDKYEKLGLIETADGMIRFTDCGHDLANIVLCEFI